MRFRVKDGWLRFIAQTEKDRQTLLRLYTSLDGEAVVHYWHNEGRLTIKLVPGDLAELRRDLAAVQVL